MRPEGTKKTTIVISHHVNQGTPMLAAEARESMVRIAQTVKSRRSAWPRTRSNEDGSLKGSPLYSRRATASRSDGDHIPPRRRGEPPGGSRGPRTRGVGLGL